MYTECSHLDNSILVLQETKHQSKNLVFACFYCLGVFREEDFELELIIIAKHVCVCCVLCVCVCADDRYCAAGHAREEKGDNHQHRIWCFLTSLAFLLHLLCNQSKA